LQQEIAKVRAREKAFAASRRKGYAHSHIRLAKKARFKKGFFSAIL